MRIWWAKEIFPPPDNTGRGLSVVLKSDHEAAIDDLQRLPQPLKGFIPQTYGDAIMRGWIKHGDCAPHEWDNRTSAANARWMLERAGFTSDAQGDAKC